MTDSGPCAARGATCRDLHQHASAFVDGEVEPSAWPALEAHLEACPPCGEYVRQLGLTVELLRKLPGRPGHEARAELVRRFEDWTRERANSVPGGPPPSSDSVPAGGLRPSSKPR